MATLIKEHEGIMYEEDFQENSLMWSLTPSDIDCLRFNVDGLKINHNENYITYTFKEPDEPYCLIAEIEHTPLTEEDIGGIIILSNTDEYAECQTYLASSPSTIGNNGQNIYDSIDDMSNKFVRYTIDTGFSNEEVEESHNENNEHQTVLNYDANFIDTIYRFLKLVKYNDNTGYVYQFYASPNGITWIEVGSVNYPNACSIGFFLYSTENSRLLNNGNFLIKRLSLYENKYITINGISIFQDFEIYSRHNRTEIIRSDTTPGLSIINKESNTAIINTNELNLPIRNAILRVYPKGHYDETINQYDLPNDTYGGDIYTINYDIKVIIDNIEVLPGNEYDLGLLYTRKFKKNIVIYNNEDFDLGILRIKIVAYSEFFSGEEEIQIAFYDGNKADQSALSYEYSNELIINRLDSHTGVELIMKLKDRPKQEFYSAANDYKFKILIE